ncbi:hypothetical protein BDC45DRAFT_542720 [Circinella umbellata]|nr:hypothetical protein BDC45DRAFT_542720 [Circinella umbellata]
MPICSICDWDVSKSQWKNHKTNCYNEYRQKVVAIHSTPTSEFDVDDQQQLNDDYDTNDYDYDYDYDYGDTFQNDNLYGIDDHNYVYNTQDVTDESEDEEDGDMYDTLSQVSGVASSQIQLENPSIISTTTVPAQKFMIKTSSVSVTKTLKRSIRLYVEVKAKNITRELHRAFVKFYNESMIEEGLKNLCLPSIYNTEQTIMNLYPIKPRIYNICVKGCVMFKNDEDVCSVCGEARFITTPNGIKKPRNTMLYISLKDQLAIILARPTTRKIYLEQNTLQAPTEGIRGPTPFAFLKTFHSPYFWGKDEMHLFGGNLGPHLWKMTNPDSGTPFSLTLDTRKKISACIENSSRLLPATIEGRILDVLVRPGQARAVDWISMLVYAGPTLLIEAFVAKDCSLQAVEAFISLLTVVSVSLKWSIYPEDIDRIDQCAKNWHSFAWSILDHNLYTANLHYIQHIASMIRVIGPPRAYSARSAERTIGLTSKRIKSKSAAGKNAPNELYRLAACRDIMNSGQIIESNMMQDKDTNCTNKDESFYEVGDSNEKYWKQQEGVETVNIDTNIIVGTQYYRQGNLFGSAIHVSSIEARISNFVQLSIPFDVNTKRPNLPKDLQWGTFYGEIVMFFAHTYKMYFLPDGLERLLVFVRLYSNVSLNEAGIPFGSQLHGSTQGKLYVTDAQNIEGLCGYIQSGSMEGQHYYVMTDLIPNDISELGDVTFL